MKNLLRPFSILVLTIQKRVIFYSGIIGSIPGKIQMAKKIMAVFIQSLKKQLARIFIINPSEYYEPGMDADDLM